MSSFCLVGLSRLSRRQEGADVLRWVPRESSAVVVDGGDGSETAFSSHLCQRSAEDSRHGLGQELGYAWHRNDLCPFVVDLPCSSSLDCVSALAKPRPALTNSKLVINLNIQRSVAIR